MIVVIGGGASGMLAAITAAKRGERVVILEKKEQLGKKLSITGNGRCNLLNSDRAMLHFHSAESDMAEKILNRISNEEILAEFASLGILCRCKDGLYYPLSNKAQTVVSILNEWIKKLGITVKCNCTVKSLHKAEGGWVIGTDNEIIKAEEVIFAVGSRAGLSDKEKYNGIDILNRLELRKISMKPALTALTSSDKVCKYWSGVRCEANISIINDDRVVRSEYGELMLAEDGISGIAAFQLSHYVKNTSYVLIDFVPDLSEKQIKEYLSNNSRTFADRGMFEVLSSMLPAKLAQTIATELVFREEAFKGKKAHELKGSVEDPKQLQAIVNVLKSFRVDITGTRGFGESQVCGGGICLDEINENMESVKYPGLFFTGEILDVAGDCGGFNLTWAWVTALIAGSSVGR